MTTTTPIFSCFEGVLLTLLLLSGGVEFNMRPPSGFHLEKTLLINLVKGVPSWLGSWCSYRKSSSMFLCFFYFLLKSTSRKSISGFWLSTFGQIGLTPSVANRKQRALAALCSIVLSTAASVTARDVEVTVMQRRRNTYHAVPQYTIFFEFQTSCTAFVLFRKLGLHWVRSWLPKTSSVDLSWLLVGHAKIRTIPKKTEI